MFEWLRERSHRATNYAQERLFEGFTESAHQAVALAQEEARHLNSGYTDTEHILLGLRREEGSVPARVLGSFGLELDETREQIETITGYGANPVHRQTELTPRSKKVLEMARLEALQLDKDYVGPEHLLLGLVRETEGVAALLLNARGAYYDEIRRSILHALGTED